MSGLKFKKTLLIIAGGISLALGIAGMFLPVLPTTPFLLLTAACWLRGSPLLYSRLMNNPVVGKYLQDFIIHRSIPLRTKIITITTLWCVILATVIFFAEPLWLKLLLPAIATGVTVHILSFKTS